VDDGSTDGSSEMVDGYALEDERVVVIHQQNGGVSVARNAALQVFKGRYVTFVDPDDFIAQDTYLENIQFLLANSDVDILQYPYCNYINAVQDKDIQYVDSQLIVGGQQIFSSWWSGTPLEYVIWNKIYRREMWDDVIFIVGHVSEDTGLAAIFCQRANKVYISEKGMYYYQRNRTDSYTYHYSFDKHIDLFNAHYTIFQLFKKYPTMTTEKVLAFTRLFRRLIQAKQECPQADVHIQQQQLIHIFPLFSEISRSESTEKVWLYAAKILGVKCFMKLFFLYLKW
jgi:glycosyltransferase involved in cell wall biosynthesis